MAYEKFRGINIENLNPNSPKGAFQLRKVYKELYSENIPSYNFHDDKSMFYGRIDQKNNTVHVNERFLKQIKSRKSKNVMCLNFVADAFLDMKKFIKTTSSSRLIKDNFLTTKWDVKNIHLKLGWNKMYGNKKKINRYYFDSKGADRDEIRRFLQIAKDYEGD